MKKSLLIFSLSISALSAFAGVKDSDAVRALIGEAGNQSDRTLLHVASAIRNRGSLQGVYGGNNPVVAQASARQWARAERAWKLSGAHRTTPCKFFGCPGDAKYFAGIDYKPVFTSGAITFYKP